MVDRPRDRGRSSSAPRGHASSGDDRSREKRQWRVPSTGSVVAGRYRIVQLLGEGGMGVVMEAEHLELGSRVALKLLDPGHSHDPEFAERFRREARVASQLGHRNIVRVLDLGRAEDGRLFYAMELVRGEHLGQVVEREGALPAERATRIMLQICDALGAAHESGVVHRDLKPENVLIEAGPDGRDLVRIVDFGIALHLDGGGSRLTQTGGVIGTPQYMSPEQVTRRPLDSRTDVYSAGALLYELLAGTPPFCEGVPVEVMTAHIKEKPEPPRRRAPERNIHPLLEGVVLRALEKDPDDRQQTMEELSVELRAALEVMGSRAARQSAAPEPLVRAFRPGGGAAPAEPSPLPARPARARRRRRAAWALAAVLTAVAGLAVGLGFGELAPGSSTPGDGGAARAAFEPGLDWSVERAAPAGAEAEGPPPAALAGADAGAAGDPGSTDGPSAEGSSEPGRAVEPAGAAGQGGPPVREGGRPSRPASGPAADPAAPAAAGPSPTSLVAEGRARLRQGDAAGAAVLLRQAVRRAPGSAEAHAALGEAEFQRGGDAAAALAFERAVRLDPSAIRYRLLHAQVLVRLGRRAEARTALREVLRREPDNAMARRLLARLEGG